MCRIEMTRFKSALIEISRNNGTLRTLKLARRVISQGMKLSSVGILGSTRMVDFGHGPLVSLPPHRRLLAADPLGSYCRSLCYDELLVSKPPQKEIVSKSLTHSARGYNSSFGVFQTYYTAHLDNPASQIAWIGSVQVSVIFFVGAFAGRLTDAGHFHITFAVGTLLTCLGVFMTSLSTVYWQILLSQGICTGLGNGLLFTPALAVVSTYFKRRRALAFGITATGSASGGLIFPSMARQLLSRIGFGWTVRAMGLVQLVTLCLANFLLRPRVPPKRSGSVVDLASFKEKPYTCFAAGVFLVRHHLPLRLSSSQETGRILTCI